MILQSDLKFVFLFFTAAALIRIENEPTANGEPFVCTNRMGYHRPCDR